MIFALISVTKLVKPSDLLAAVAALQENAADCAAEFLIDAPAVIVLDRAEHLHPQCAPVLFVDSGSDWQSTLAEHGWDSDRRMPFARVYVDQSSGFRAGSNSVVESAGHELVEAMTDPLVAVWLKHPTRAGVEVAYEIADMAQDSYSIRGWPVANFVTPHWFRQDLAEYPEMTAALFRAGGSFDKARRMQSPGQLLPTGYVTLRKRRSDGTWRVWAEDWTGDILEPSPAKSHPLGRTWRRGAFG